MFIDTNIAPYSIEDSASVAEALTKMGESKKRIIFTLNKAGCLAGALSDGDFRRWVLRAIVDRERGAMVGHIGCHAQPGAAYLEPWAPGGSRRLGRRIEACGFVD